MSDYPGTATYSAEDNKLRFYPFSRLSSEDYTNVKAHGFIWAPKQELFVASMWTPSRNDFLVSICGEIDDEDISITDRAQQRADRFEQYSDNRAKEAEQTEKAVSAITDGIPFGQPILIGHHSEKRHRNQLEKVHNGTRKYIKLWEQSEYWKDRAANSIRAAKYKERPEVRARRIKKLEAEQRKYIKDKKEAETALSFWSGTLKAKTGEIIIPGTKNALWFLNYCDHIYMEFPLDKYPRNPPASQYEGSQSMWAALGGDDGDDHAIITVEQAKEIAIPIHTRTVNYCNRWISHFENRLTYEKTMLQADGGIESDKTRPEKGGACQCWVRRGKWSEIIKVNKVTVAVLDNWGNGGPDFIRTIPFDKLEKILSKSEWDEMK